jgi:hypothetical protein
MDSNGDGSVSNGELLSANGSLGKVASPISQDLLSLMDTNGDRSVNGTEMINFESAVVAAEKAPGLRHCRCLLTTISSGRRTGLPEELHTHQALNNRNHPVTVQ